MTKQIGNTMVTDELYSFAKSMCDRGGKVFLSQMAVEHTGEYAPVSCTNCNGGGTLLVEYLVTPLSDSPLPGNTGGGDGLGNPMTSMVYKDKWAGKKMKSYPCPVCNKLANASRELKL